MCCWWNSIWKGYWFAIGNYGIHVAVEKDGVIPWSAGLNE